MPNKYLDRRAVHSIGKGGRASEVRLAKKIGGRARPASGAMEGAKGDIVLGNVLMEAKSTEGASIGLKHEWLAKIAKEARSEGKLPALALSFINPDGRPVPSGEWVCITLADWRLLCGSSE